MKEYWSEGAIMEAQGLVPSRLSNYNVFDRDHEFVYKR